MKDLLTYLLTAGLMVPLTLLAASVVGLLLVLNLGVGNGDRDD